MRIRLFRLVGLSILFLAILRQSVYFANMLTYLALGDSYTIGELVPLPENFPCQVVRLLRGQNIDIKDPVIIAKTGWTTDELQLAITEADIQEQYSMVTLLIGVNNQYRGRPVAQFQTEFTALLQQAIAFADQRPDRVFVLSIPDWGVTPFAADRDRPQIAREIDAYNEAKQAIALAHNCPFLDITDSTRAHGALEDYLVSDQLHPSGTEYTVWAERLLPLVLGALRSA